MSELREAVEQAIRKDMTYYYGDTSVRVIAKLTDAAIRAVIEALAAEADGAPRAFSRISEGMGHNEGGNVADWLRGHIGDTEATG